MKMTLHGLLFVAIPAGAAIVMALCRNWSMEPPAPRQILPETEGMQSPSGGHRPAVFVAGKVDDGLRQSSGETRESAEVPGASARQMALVETCRRLAEGDPVAGLSLARRLEPEDPVAAATAVESIVQHWASSDAPAAMAWVVQQPAGEERDHWMGRVVFVWSQDQPLAAACFVGAEMSLGLAQDETSISVLHQLALRDPTAALSWVERFPSGELQHRALRELECIVAHRLGSL